MTARLSRPAARPRAAAGRLLVIGALYLVSNIGYSFFVLTVGTILLERDVPMGTVAVVNLLGGVYFGRFLLAPVLDRFGTYRAWLVSTQVGLVGVLVAVAALDPVRHLPALMVLMTVVLVLSAFHDTALGGLTVRLLPATQHGMANGVQIASASASILIGSSGALLLYAHVGWTATLLALAAVFVLPLAVLARLTEPEAPRTEPPQAPWRELAGFFRRPHMTVWTLLVIPLYGIGDWLATAPQAALLLSAGWPMDRVASARSLATAVQIAAALVTGAAIARYGRSRSALVIGLLGVVAVAALLPAATGTAATAPTTAALVAGAIVYGAKLTWISTVCMNLARRSSAATDYTVPMSIEGICVTLTGSAALGLASAIGFPGLLTTAALLAAAGTAVACTWTRRHAP
ncbi:MAG TPA: MFS transporter [Thermomonospora sp.]|nr:MFS transporter [Thermomonospora sp.]